MKRVSSIAVASVTIAALSLPATTSAATLVGDQVTCDTDTSLLSCSSDTSTVGDGIEFSLPDSFGFNSLTADFTADRLILGSPSSISFQGSSDVPISFTNATSPFTSAMLISGDSDGEFTASDLMFDNGRLTLDLNGVRLSPSSSITIGLSTMGAIPEPSTWAFMIIGFAVVGTGLRRRKQKAVVGYA